MKYGPWKSVPTQLLGSLLVSVRSCYLLASGLLPFSLRLDIPWCLLSPPTFLLHSTEGNIEALVF